MELNIEYLDMIRIFLNMTEDEKNCHKPVKVSNFWNNNYI